jgi:hypothetical protein
MARIPAGQPGKCSRPVSSATRAPSRTPPSALIAADQAEAGRVLIAVRSGSPMDQPSEYCTRRAVF